MALFESYERREKQILAVIKEYGINSIEECAEVCKAKGLDIYKMVEGIQPICFENAKWAYTVGCAIAIKKGCTRAADAAAAIGEGLHTSHSLLLKVLSVSLRRLTRFVRSLSVLSSTVSARTLLRSSLVSTDSHTSRQRWTTLQVKLRKYSARLTQQVSVLRLTATALTM